MLPFTPTHPQAALAIHAARNRDRWGRWATMRFAQRRGVPLSLLTLAIVLERSQRVI